LSLAQAAALAVPWRNCWLKRGCHLAICDINGEGLQATAEQAARDGLRLSQHVIDLSNRQAVAALPEQVLAAHPGVDVLINNAGIAVGGTFEQVCEAHFDRVMAINFDSVVSMSRAFLPLLKQQPEAQLVNVSSLFGLVSPPGQTAYCASKFAVRGFSNSLRHELAGSSVGVTVVHPGGVSTGIARNALGAEIGNAERERHVVQMEKKLRMPPQRAAEIIVNGIEKRKARVLVGNDARILSWLERLMPVSYWAVLTKLTGGKL
jgi:short-subunit dehydrogenase